MFKSTGARAVPQRAGSEETRRILFETALALFRERGFEETTLRDIASQAELSLGAAYYYFPSKEAIVGAYYEYVQEKHVELARAAFARPGSLRERLRAALHTKIDVMEEDRRAALLSVTDEGRDFVRRIRAAKRAAITEMLEHWTPEERAELGRVLGRLANEMVAFGCRER